MISDLLKNEKDDISKRDYLYYIAVGHTRLKVSGNKTDRTAQCTLRKYLQVDSKALSEEEPAHEAGRGMLQKCCRSITSRTVYLNMASVPRIARD